MSQNWGSGQTSTGSKTSTTNKYFNPGAILDLTKYYGQQLGGYGALNNSILYGGNAPAATSIFGTPAGTPASGTPASGTPAAGTPAAGTPAGGTPAGGTPAGGAGGTPAGGGGEPKHITPVALASYGEVPASSAASQTVNDAETSGAPVHKAVTGNSGGIVLGGTPTPYSGPGDTPADQGGGPTDQTGTPTDQSGGLLGALQKLLAGGGYSDAEKQAITEKAAEALAAQKGSAQSQMAGQLARSGNAAGYGGAMASLDNSAAQTASDQARQNQIDFANEGERRAELGASGLTSLLGINTAASLGTSGQAAGLAGLGGGVDTSTAGESSFSNQNFQATPDSSAKPGTGTAGGAKPTTGGGPAGGGINPATGKQDPNFTADGTRIGQPDHNGLMPSDPGYGEISPGDSVDASGNSPGDAGYDPTTDPTNPAYNPPETYPGGSAGGGDTGGGGGDTYPGSPGTGDTTDWDAILSQLLGEGY